MIFVLDETDVLHIANSDAELNGAFEGVDVEGGVYRFFDASGRPLVAEFIVPNERGRGTLGLRWVRSGIYKLVPSNDAAALHLSGVFDTIVAVKLNELFPDIEEVRRALRLVTAMGPAVDARMKHASCLEVHPESYFAPRWIQIIAGLVLGGFTLLSLAGAVTLVISENARAPLLAPAGGIVMVLACCWLLWKCARLVRGRRGKSDLLGPRALRLVAWIFLLLPVAGVFSGYFVSHALVASVQTVVHITAFFGLRSLAQYRERQAEI